MFIQDKATKSIFYSFNPDNDLVLDYIFIFNEEISFYNEIGRFIKDKGFENYISKRKINSNSTQMIHKLKDKDKNNNIYDIGECIIFSNLNENKAKRNKIKNKLVEYEKYYSHYSQFISKFYTIKDNNISENDFIFIKAFSFFIIFDNYYN